MAPALRLCVTTLLRVANQICRANQRPTVSPPHYRILVKQPLEYVKRPGSLLHEKKTTQTPPPSGVWAWRGPFWPPAVAPLTATPP